MFEIRLKLGKFSTWEWYKLSSQSRWWRYMILLFHSLYAVLFFPSQSRIIVHDILVSYGVRVIRVGVNESTIKRSFKRSCLIEEEIRKHRSVLRVIAFLPGSSGRRYRQTVVGIRDILALFNQGKRYGVERFVVFAMDDEWEETASSMRAKELRNRAAAAPEGYTVPFTSECSEPITVYLMWNPRQFICVTRPRRLGRRRLRKNQFGRCTAVRIANDRVEQHCDRRLYFPRIFRCSNFVRQSANIFSWLLCMYYYDVWLLCICTYFY